MQLIYFFISLNNFIKFIKIILQVYIEGGLEPFIEIGYHRDLILLRWALLTWARKHPLSNTLALEEQKIHTKK